MDIRWNVKYLVGHDRIDHEHQVFFDLVKNVAAAQEQKLPKDMILRLLIEVRKYADFHFYSEENMMIASGYPAYEWHKEEHNKLLTILDREVEKYQAGDCELMEIILFMIDWFTQHTTKTDKLVADHINARRKD